MENMTLISIDGPSAAGKTTLGRCLAERLDLPFVDTGLTFRTLAFVFSDNSGPPDVTELRSAIERIAHIPYRRSTAIRNEEAVFLDGNDVTHLIWSEHCNSALPWVTDNPEARELLLDFHRQLVRGGAVVAGRDTAVELLPHARLKIVLNAEFSVRRERRREQIRRGGCGTVVLGASTSIDIATLDAMRQDPHGLVVDTTYLDPDSVCAIAMQALLR